MIVTYKEDGWQVVTQRSHGILAAQVGAQWKIKERPSRWTDTLLAIAGVLLQYVFISGIHFRKPTLSFFSVKLFACSLSKPVPPPALLERLCESLQKRQIVIA